MIRFRRLVITICLLALVSLGSQVQAFDDVTDGYWAEDEIAYLDALEVMNGYNAQTFGPEDEMTRVQALKAIMSALEVPVTKYSTSSFKDVSKTHPLFDYIETAKRSGIIDGLKDGTFHPDDAVDRASFVKMLLETGDQVLEAPSMEEPYSDVDPTDWYAKYVYSARELELITGYNDNTFRPMVEVKRSEAAVMLYRYLEAEKYLFPLLSEEEEQVLELINKSRTDAGGTPLVLDLKLSRIAREHSQALFDEYHSWTDEMKNQYIEDHPGEEVPWTSHDDPETKADFESRFQEAAEAYNLNFDQAGENIGFAFWNTHPVEVQLVAIHDAMMQQANNQAANILGTDVPYTHVGIGVVVGDDPNPKEIYVTQVFISAE